MLRKLVLAVATVAALGGATAISTTPAAAWGGHGWHGGGWHGGGGWRGGYGWGGPRFYYGGGPYAYAGGGCLVRRLVPTPWGYRYRLVNRCY